MVRHPRHRADAGPDSAQLVGVSCKGTTCIFAKDAISIAHGLPAQYFWQPPPAPPYTIPVGTMELHRVSLSTGADELLFGNALHVVFATPKISPVTGDLVVQIGGGWGHLQTWSTNAMPILWFTDGNSVLHLYQGLVP